MGTRTAPEFKKVHQSLKKIPALVPSNSWVAGVSVACSPACLQLSNTVVSEAVAAMVCLLWRSCRPSLKINHLHLVAMSSGIN